MNKITKKIFLTAIFSKYKKRYTVSFVFMVISAVIISLMPQIINNIFDRAIVQKDLYKLIFYMILYIILSILYNIIDMNNNNLFTKTGAMVVRDIREKLCISISEKNGDYYTKLKTGDLANRILAEVEYVESFITQNLFIILSDLFMFLGVGIVLFRINYLMMFLILLFQPLIIMIQNKFGIKSTKLTRKFRETYQNMCSATTEFLNNIMCIVFSHATHYYLEKYSILQENVIYDAINCQKNGNKSYFFQDILSNIIIIAVIGYGGFAVMRGDLTIGELIAFNMYVNKIFMCINRMSKSYIKFKQFDVYLERLIEIFNNANNEQRTKKFIFNKCIKYENISFKYDTNNVLNGLTFCINKGQKIAIVGESGSGKSTLINLLYALWKCENGQILIDNVNINDISLKHLRERIAIVSQNAFFYNDTIFNNIALGKNVDYKTVEYACKLAHIHDYIMTLPEKYNTIIQENGKNLSGGQKQRLSIARGLLNTDAEIFCLDEPTSAVDNIISKTVEHNILENLSGKTVLTITHKIARTQYYDYIYLIENGQVQEQGTYEELLNLKGKFYKMYTTENG